MTLNGRKALPGLDPTDILALLLSVGAVAWILPWNLLLLPTTPTGGDTPSQFAALQFFINETLPRGRLWAWNPGGLAGYPFFQFYFPLPFLAMAALAQLTGPAVAFKLLTAAPALALPVSVFASLRLMGLRRPGPALGAALGLLFLLSEQNTVWGGNLASILAGEICYAWAFNLTLIYLGLLPGWLRGRRGPFWPAVLLALIGFSHSYGLLFCLTAGLYFPLFQSPFRRLAARLFMTYVLAFLLLAVWTIPMLVYSPYTEMFNFVWVVDSVWDFLPPTLLPALVLAPLGAALPFRRGGRPSRERAGYLGFCLLAAATLYLAAPYMNAVTVRFAPFGHMAALLLAAQGLELAMRGLRHRWVLALAAAAAAGLFATSRMDYLPHWLAWNNSGLEQKAAWPNVKALCDYLRPASGRWEPGAPRVVYEHAAINGQAGSVRVFESLPQLAGRSTLEGLYLQASPNAPFVFYLQSEISRRGSSPLPGYVYSGPNLARGLEHMRLFNASQYITADPETRRRADSQPGLVLEREFGPYSVYRVEGGDGRYLAYPVNRPLLVITRRPQTIAHAWFRFTDLRTPLALAPRLAPGDRERFARVYHDSGNDDDPLLKAIRADRLPKIPLPPAPGPGGERVSCETMTAEGLAPGRPLIIKASFHPAWRASGGERIYRVTPAFMLVFPRRDVLTLSFGRAWPHFLGEALTLLGLALLLLVTARPGLWRTHWLRPAPDAGRVRFAPRAAGLAALLAVLCLMAWRNDDATTLRLKAHKLIAQNKQAEAARYLQEGLRRFPHSLAADYTLYDLAMTYHRRGRYHDSTRLFQKLRRLYPDSIVLPETLFHLGLGLGELGLSKEKARLKRELLQRFPDNRWSKEAKKWP